MIEQKVYNIIAEALCFSKADFKPSLNLRKDLFASTSGLRTVAEFINDDFNLNVNITDADINLWQTVDDIVKIVERRIV